MHDRLALTASKLGALDQERGALRSEHGTYTLVMQNTPGAPPVSHVESSPGKVYVVKKLVLHEVDEGFLQVILRQYRAAYTGIYQTLEVKTNRHHYNREDYSVILETRLVPALV